MVGLLVYWMIKNKSEHSITGLKPSQIDFSESNKTTSLEGRPLNDEILVSATSSLKPNENQLASPKFSQVKDQNLWKTFEEIIQTKNDNDPRLDQDFKNLSLEFKQALMQKYNSFALENRNDRGFVVYLIARNLQTTEDIQFLKSVYEETPCKSLEDCSKPAASDPHHEDINQTSLDYPQKVGLYLLEKNLAQNPEKLKNVDFRNAALQVLIQAENFPVPSIQDKARQIREKYAL